jgi:hypothetical protein
MRERKTMFAKKTAATVRILAHCPNGCARFFLTRMEIETPRVPFAAASVLGFSYQEGTFSDNHLAQDPESAEKWATDYVRQRLGEGVPFGQREEIRE